MNDSTSSDPSQPSSGGTVNSQLPQRLNYTIRIFAPERWGQVNRFSTFFSASFPDATSIERRAVSGVGNHFRKALVLRSLALRLAPNLSIDQEQLDSRGYTAAEHGVELAAVIENVFTELYSAVDCARKIVSSRYPLRGVPDSTRKMFDRARNGKLDGILPNSLVSAFKEADWYGPLRVLRDELTHSDIGSVHQDRASGLVTYMHRGLGSDQQALTIENIFARLDADVDAVNRFLGVVFLQLNSILKDKPTTQVCGMHQGKVLMREIRPEPVITFDSGRCLSVSWIEVNNKPTCPLLCGAYWRTKSEIAKSLSNSSDEARS
jgi:hypothetical protein